MEDKCYILNKFIGKHELELILRNTKLNFKLGGIKPYENFCVSNSKNEVILVVDINDINANGVSVNENESLDEFLTAGVRLPMGYSHILDLEYANIDVLKSFENALKNYCDDVYYYDDYKNKFIKV